MVPCTNRFSAYTATLTSSIGCPSEPSDMNPLSVAVWALTELGTERIDATKRSSTMLNLVKDLNEHLFAGGIIG